MKRILLLVALLALLCSCGKGDPAIYDVTKDGMTFTVDRTAKTITRGEIVYQYEVSGQNVTVTYPNGASYFQQHYPGGTVSTYSAGWNEIYESSHDIPGETLVAVLAKEWVPRGSSSRGNPLLGLLIIALGGWNVISPRTAWEVSYGWRYKDAEPSDAALYVGRIGGIVALFIGVVVMFA